MFGLIADLIASCTTILLPAYLSYKSIRSGDPGQTTPWLIYFIILSLALLFESWTVFIIGWFPFYSWIRLCFLLYLVLPQTQGAKLLYLDYVEPYIVSHERSIDQFIGETHDKLERMGLSYLSVLVDYVREKILGQASPQPHSASSQQAGGGSSASGNAASYSGSVGNYASDLLSRFAMPQARTQAAASGGLSSLLSAAFTQGTTTQTSPLTATRSTTSIDPHSSTSFDLSSIQAYLTNPSTSTTEKSRTLQSNREKLSTLLKILEKEQQSLDLAYGSTPGLGLSSKSKSQSEQSFEQVSYDEIRNIPGGIGYGPQQTSSPGSPRQSSSRNVSVRSERSTSGSAGGGWSSGWFGTGSGSTQPASRKQRDYDDASDDGDADDSATITDRRTGKGSSGWNAARDITEAIMSSGSDRRDGDSGGYRR